LFAGAPKNKNKSDDPKKSPVTDFSSGLEGGSPTQKLREVWYISLAMIRCRSVCLLGGVSIFVRLYRVEPEHEGERSEPKNIRPGPGLKRLREIRWAAEHQ